MADHGGSFRIEHRAKGLTLVDCDGRTALWVDFLSGTWNRRTAAGGKKQPLAKAVGVGGETVRILDATAGLCRDALFLASLGCKVTAVERNAHLFALIEDAWKRAVADPRGGPFISKNLIIAYGDALDFVADKNITKTFDAIYLDPMYPDSEKTALPKKELQTLRKLLGKRDDARDLFEAMKKSRPRRLVVKRPLHAESLAGRPAHTFRGSRVRFDLYLGDE